MLPESGELKYSKNWKALRECIMSAKYTMMLSCTRLHVYTFTYAPP